MEGPGRSPAIYRDALYADFITAPLVLLGERFPTMQLSRVVHGKLWTIDNDTFAAALSSTELISRRYLVQQACLQFHKDYTFILCKILTVTLGVLLIVLAILQHYQS